MGGSLMWESISGQYGTIEMEARNSQGEKTTIERLEEGPFEGQALLCIYDDDTPIVAITLLDEGLISKLGLWITTRSQQ